jgi:hypothetical protein
MERLDAPHTRARPAPRVKARLFAAEIAAECTAALHQGKSFGAFQAWPDREAAKILTWAGAKLWEKTYSTALVLHRAVKDGLMTREEAEERFEEMGEAREHAMKLICDGADLQFEYPDRYYPGALTGAPTNKSREGRR